MRKFYIQKPHEQLFYDVYRSQGWTRRASRERAQWAADIVKHVHELFVNKINAAIIGAITRVICEAKEHEEKEGSE